MYSFTCSKHPLEKVNNFCNNPECLLPLCSSCIVEHIITHYQQGSLPELLDFNKVRDQCIDKIKKLRGSLNSAITQFQKSYEELPGNQQNEVNKVRKSREDVNTLIDEFYEDVLKKADLPSKSVQTKLQRILEEVQVLEGKFYGEDYHEAIRLFFKRNFEQEIDEVQSSNSVNRGDMNACKDIKKVEVNYTALERIKKELMGFVNVVNEDNSEGLNSKDNEEPTQSAETSKCSPASGSQGISSRKGKDSVINEQVQPALTKTSEDKFSTQFLTPPQEHLCDHLSTGIPEESFGFQPKTTGETGESDPTRSSPTISKSLLIERKNAISTVTPRNLNFADTALRMNEEITTSTVIKQTIELAAPPSKKSELPKPESSTVDILSRFRQKFNSVQNKAPSKEITHLEDPEEPITLKRKGGEEIEKEEPSLKKLFKFDSKPEPRLSLGSDPSLKEKEGELIIPSGSITFSGLGGQTHLRRPFSCLPSTSKDEAACLIDESKFLEESMGTSSPYQLSQQDLDTSLVPHYYFIGENDASGKESVFSQSQKVFGTPMNIEQDDILKENLSRSVTKKDNSESFKVTIGNYFSPNAKVKLLHFFEWRSKNLHLASFDQLDINPDAFKFKKMTLTMNFLIRDYHTSLITPDGEIYMLGGRITTNKDFKQYNELHTVNLEEHRLVPKAPMLEKRDSHAMCYSNGYIYAIGGVTLDIENRLVVSRTCEKYDIAANKWTEIAQVPLPVSNHCACVFRDEYIFCFGGRHKPNKLSNNILRYNIEKDAWLCLNLKSVSQGRINFGLTSQGACCQLNDNNIFVFGGYHDNRAVSDQSFLFSYLPEGAESLFSKSKSESKDVQGKATWVIKGLNNKKVNFAAPFWDKQVIPHNGKIYCLQNAVSVNNPKVAFSNMRRLLVFDGFKWNNLKYS